MSRVNKKQMKEGLIKTGCDKKKQVKGKGIWEKGARKIWEKGFDMREEAEENMGDGGEEMNLLMPTMVSGAHIPPL